MLRNSWGLLKCWGLEMWPQKGRRYRNDEQIGNLQAKCQMSSHFQGTMTTEKSPLPFYKAAEM